MFKNKFSLLIKQILWKFCFTKFNNERVNYLHKNEIKKKDLIKLDKDEPASDFKSFCKLTIRAMTKQDKPLNNT